MPEVKAPKKTATEKSKVSPKNNTKTDVNSEKQVAQKAKDDVMI